MSIIFFILIFSSITYADHKPLSPKEYLEIHLNKVGFTQVLISPLGEGKIDHNNYTFHEVVCRFKISRCAVNYRLINKGGVLNEKSKSIWYRVESQSQGWKAKNNLSKGKKINHTDIEWGMRNGFTCTSNAPLKKKELINRVVISNIKSGAPLCLSDLEKERDVNKNDVVQLISRSVGFDLFLSAKALESGNVGDIVKVRVKRSAKILQAVVVEKDQVELAK
ncbi:flagellar basal body P-ring formation protein FlgA [Vibrio chagasii]|uniref:Flagella basal body P-ring formation protein FlgA n=1 Tax=Vibrio chagasii TaxID=170679 RepID=A0A7V7NPY4_9VIBR|nr:flagellar basal body P-ring formation protein FlgA [Vibrio chagasii]